MHAIETVDVIDSCIGLLTHYINKLHVQNVVRHLYTWLAEA